MPRILVGELEFNERHYHPCGGPQSFLFVATEFLPNWENVEYVYFIGPYPQPETGHVGNVYRTKHNISVTEFLQRFVDDDEQIGRGVVKSLANCKVRLKGMTEWIERKN
jgi:hypothetical protein